MTPVYVHDCAKDDYLGRFDRQDTLGQFDLWWAGHEPSVIVRYSSDGPDYFSGLSALGVDAEHADLPYFQAALEAYRRAEQAGLVSDEVRRTALGYLIRGVFATEDDVACTVSWALELAAGDGESQAHAEELLGVCLAHPRCSAEVLALLVEQGRDVFTFATVDGGGRQVVAVSDAARVRLQGETAPAAAGGAPSVVRLPASPVANPDRTRSL